MAVSLVATATSEPTAKQVCPVCEKEFEKTNNSQKCCSPKCRAKRYYYANREQRHKHTNAWRKDNAESCRASFARYYATNRERLLQKSHDRSKAMREWVDGLKTASKCVKCGEARAICLEFHHLNGSGKEANLSRLRAGNCSKERFLAELEKCIVLCRNCHAVEHWGHLVEESL